MKIGKEGRKEEGRWEGGREGRRKQGRCELLLGRVPCLPE